MRTCFTDNSKHFAGTTHTYKAAESHPPPRVSLMDSGEVKYSQWAKHYEVREGYLVVHFVRKKTPPVI